MLPCTRCANLIHEEAVNCPFCGAAVEVSPTVRPWPAILLGLTLMGCPKPSPPTPSPEPEPQPEYGIPITDILSEAVEEEAQEDPER